MKHSGLPVFLFLFVVLAPGAPIDAEAWGYVYYDRLLAGTSKLGELNPVTRRFEDDESRPRDPADLKREVAAVDQEMARIEKALAAMKKELAAKIRASRNGGGHPDELRRKHIREERVLTNRNYTLFKKKVALENFHGNHGLTAPDSIIPGLQEMVRETRAALDEEAAARGIDFVFDASLCRAFQRDFSRVVPPPELLSFQNSYFEFLHGTGDPGAALAWMRLLPLFKKGRPVDPVLRGAVDLTGPILQRLVKKPDAGSDSK